MILLWFLIVALGAAAICAVRAILGPTAPDRMVALDGLSAIMIAALVILGVYYRVSMLLDVALVYALLSFLGTLAIAKYLEGRGIES